MNVVRRITRPLLPLTLVALVSAACGTLGGAAIGAGSGAAIGAGVDSKNRGRGAANGALIGTGVGAAGVASSTSTATAAWESRCWVCFVCGKMFLAGR